MANDYNRALARPVRAAHVAIAGLRELLRPILGWAFERPRRDWAAPILLGLIGFFLLWPLDGPLAAAVQALSNHLSGDLRRELTASQQFGAIGSLLFTALVIWLIDPAHRRRLLDLAAAAVLSALACDLLKAFVGRPRPRLGTSDPFTFLSPWGMYPIDSGGKGILAHAWESAAVRSSDLWSMPSSHTAAAAVLAVFLARLYPRLRPLCIALAILVGFDRVLFSAHWPTDVIMGAAVGYAAASLAVGRGWGVRALDWLWLRFIDRNATPAYPAQR